MASAHTATIPTALRAIDADSAGSPPKKLTRPSACGCKCDAISGPQQRGPQSRQRPGGGMEVACHATVSASKTRSQRGQVKADDGVDLLREFVDLYSREEMLAFFEFRLEQAGGRDIEGLCRISQPKDGRSNLYYLSLGFVVDTPDEASRACVDDALSRLDGEALRAAVPNVVEVLPVTSMTTGPESFVRQADILFDEDSAADPATTLAALVPALAKITGMRASELVWWSGANS